MDILLAINGTGPGSIQEYSRQMAASHVLRIHDESRCSPKRYMRGPTGAGTEMHGIIDAGHAWIGQMREMGSGGMLSGGEARILLTGFSRGAAAIVAIAQRLERESVPVAAMMLFDCVDRAIGVSTDTIPGNVVDVLHARRHPDAGSRESFGSSGTHYTGSTRYRQRLFRCTHGAVGGDPAYEGPIGELVDEGIPDYGTNVTYGDDQIVSNEVWSWVRPYLVRMGFIG